MFDMDSSPAAAAVAALGAALEQAQQAVADELWRSVDGELADLIEAVHRHQGQLQSVVLNLLAEFTERGVPEAIGAVNARVWLRHRLRETPSAAGAPPPRWPPPARPRAPTPRSAPHSRRGP